MVGSEASKRRSVRWWHWVVALILIAFSLFFIYDANELSAAGSIGLGPGAVPRAMAIIMLVLSVGYALSLWSASSAPEPNDDGTRPALGSGGEDLPPAAGSPTRVGLTVIDRPLSVLSPRIAAARGMPITYMVISFVSLALVNVVGFYVALAVLTLGCCIGAQAASWPKVILLAGGIVGFTWLVFGQLLGIYYPLGTLFE